MAKAEFHFGELFPVVGFIVTNLATSSPPTSNPGSNVAFAKPPGADATVNQN